MNRNGRFYTGVTFNQDYMCWITQGAVAQRDKEMLGQSDIGLILFRKMLRQQMKVVEDGGDPMNVFRDPAKANHIALPMESVKHGIKPDGRYRPGEGGDSPIVPMIEEVLRTWVPEGVAAQPKDLELF